MEKLVVGTLTLMMLLVFSCSNQKKEASAPRSDELTASCLQEKTTNYFKTWSYEDRLLHEKQTGIQFHRTVNGNLVSQGSDELLETICFWHRALPDLKIRAGEIVVVGKKTYVTWTLTGTNTGMFGDIPPTGKKGSTQGFSVLTFDNDARLIEEAAYFDVFTLMTDWGYSVVPPVME